MSEQWKPVLGFEGMYEVSDVGRVRRLAGAVMRSDGVVQPLPPIDLAGRVMGNGYQNFSFTHKGVRVVRGGHVLVLEAFVGPRPEGMDACHNNGVKLDNRLENLRWDTKSANSLDAVMHGVHPNARKTHCRAGHPYDGENTHVTPEGHRKCRRCIRAQFVRTREHSNRLQRERRAAKKKGTK